MNNEIKYYKLCVDLRKDGGITTTWYNFIKIENLTKKMLYWLSEIKYAGNTDELLQAIKATLENGKKLKYVVNENWVEFKIEEEKIKFDDPDYEVGYWVVDK